MDLTYKQEVSVGGMVLAGVVLFVAAMFWLTGRSFRATGVDVEVQFENISGLKIGDPVMVSGVRKGRVAGVRLEEPGRVIVTLDVEAGVQPRIDAAATVASLDFFGAKFIDYVPGKRSEPFPGGRPIVGTRGGDLADIASGISQRANELLDSATAMISSRMSDDLHNTLVAVQAAMQVISSTGQGPLVPQITATLQATERALVRVDSILGADNGGRIDTLTASLAELSRSLARSSASLDTMLRMMRRGEGSLGRLATDSTLYVNLSKVLASLDSVLVDFKLRPGRYLPTVKVF